MPNGFGKPSSMQFYGKSLETWGDFYYNASHELRHAYWDYYTGRITTEGFQHFFMIPIDNKNKNVFGLTGTYQGKI